MHFDPGNEAAPPLRSKEEAQDYRYLPEPDLVPLEPPRELVERLRGELPELPGARVRRLTAEVGFELAEGLVTSDRDPEAIEATCDEHVRVVERECVGDAADARPR